MSTARLGGNPAGWVVWRCVAAARQEAETARHGYVGVEHLLVALTLESAGQVSRILAEHGVTYPRAQEAMRLVIGSGRGDGPRFDAGTLLATLGIDLGEIQRQVTTRFGPDAIKHLYTSPVGWNLRPRGPLCGPAPGPMLKRALDNGIGRCWDKAPVPVHEHLLLGALDADSAGLARVLDELGASALVLRAAMVTGLRAAG